MKRYSVFIVSLLISSMLLTACSQSKKQEVENTAKTSSLSLVVSQIGEIPPKNNEMEKAIEAYTNVDLQIQWIPIFGL